MPGRVVNGFYLNPRPRAQNEDEAINVPGLYVAGTLRAGRDTNRIFIENSREHSPRIVAHLRERLST